MRCHAATRVPKFIFGVDAGIIVVFLSFLSSSVFLRSSRNSPLKKTDEDRQDESAAGRGTSSHLAFCAGLVPF